METEKNHTCCFFGHRKINEPDEFKNTLLGIIENLIINEGIDTFLFGSKSEFDDLCREAVTALKERHPHIRRIYVRAEFPYIDDGYREYLLESYDDTYFPDKIINAGKAAYVERNFEMIDKSRICVIYYNESYAPPERKNSNRDLASYQPKSGTKLAYGYAIKKDRVIVNTFV